MLIEIHAIQNHNPANLNRDDLGAPKTCYFGGVLRARISSQCIKRSIRFSPYFESLLGGIRTRQLAKLIAEQLDGKAEVKKRAEKILESCGIKSKDKDDDKSKMLVFTTREAVRKMAQILRNEEGKNDEELKEEIGRIICEEVAVPDMALCGRMLETGELKNTTVEAALQCAHAISTHKANLEVDYFIAADDIPGEDAGAGYIDEAMFNSACFYKYFSINWETLLDNLKGFKGNKEHLSAHTIGAFIKALALTTPTGKQNSFAAHNPPDGILVEFRNSPLSYANAFVEPAVATDEKSLVAQSISQLAQYVHDLDIGYGKPEHRFWFSPNMRYPLTVVDDEKEKNLADINLKVLDDLIVKVIETLGFNWEEVKKVTINQEGS